MLGSLTLHAPLFVGGRAHQELPSRDRHHLQGYPTPEGLWGMAARAAGNRRAS